MANLETIIAIIQIVRDKITNDTDVTWAGYDSAAELQADIDKDLDELTKGNLEKLDTFRYHFLPTATFQEISLSNGWGDEYITLANNYDRLYENLKSLKPR